jgi:hypothetical protein
MLAAFASDRTSTSTLFIHLNYSFYCIYNEECGEALSHHQSSIRMARFGMNELLIELRQDGISQNHQIQEKFLNSGVAAAHLIVCNSSRKRRLGIGH